MFEGERPVNKLWLFPRFFTSQLKVIFLWVLIAICIAHFCFGVTHLVWSKACKSLACITNGYPCIMPDDWSGSWCWVSLTARPSPGYQHAPLAIRFQQGLVYHLSSIRECTCTLCDSLGRCLTTWMIAFILFKDLLVLKQWTIHSLVLYLVYIQY